MLVHVSHYELLRYRFFTVKRLTDQSNYDEEIQSNELLIEINMQDSFNWEVQKIVL